MKKNSEYPAVSWFRERTASFKECWDEAGWQENGERALKPIMQSLRLYAAHLKKLPENFLPSVFDQHLAVLSEGYEYQIMDIVTDIGYDRYLCRSESGEEFCLWSLALTTTIKEGGVSFMTAVIRLADDADGSVPAITYGPVLTWNSLHARDFSMIGSELARDLFRLKGLPELIRRDPVPFWALWTLGNFPRVMHKSEEMCSCWHEGKFTADPAPLLTGTWKRDVIGKRIRFRKSGSKLFFEQIVVYDVKSSRGILLTRRGSYLEKLKVALTTVFIPDSERAVVASTSLEIGFSDILKKKLSYFSWTKAFDQQDTRKSGEQRKHNPENEAVRDKLNEAMTELVPYINARKEPDWPSFAVRHALAPETIESLKSLYRKFSRGK